MSLAAPPPHTHTPWGRSFLGTEGLSAHGLTVDHYYRPLNEQPRYQARKQRSDVDYDHIESMDVELVNAHIR